MHRSTSLPLALLLALTTVWTASAESPAGPSTPPRPVLDHFEFLSGGTWITDNASDASTPDGPAGYALEYESILGKRGVRGFLHGLDEKGETTTVYWEMVTYWDPESRSVVHVQFAPNGTIARATVEHLGPEPVFEAVMTVHRPDGEGGIRIRDRLTETGPDEMRTVSRVWRDGEWVPMREDVWRREGDSSEEDVDPRG